MTRLTDEGVTVAAAARRLGTTPLNVLMHIKRGELAGEERADGWRVDAASLDALCRRRAQGGVSLVCRSGCGKAAGCGTCA